MKESYAGKISNNGAMKVEPLFKTQTQNKPKVQKSGDLRSKPSQKNK